MLPGHLATASPEPFRNAEVRWLRVALVLTVLLGVRSVAAETADSWSVAPVTLAKGQWIKWSFDVPTQEAADDLNGAALATRWNWDLRAALPEVNVRANYVLMVNDFLAPHDGAPGTTAHNLNWFADRRFALAGYLNYQGFLMGNVSHCGTMPPAGYGGGGGPIRSVFVVGTNTIRILNLGGTHFTNQGCNFTEDVPLEIDVLRLCFNGHVSGSPFGTPGQVEPKPGDFDSHVNPDPMASGDPGTNVILLKPSEGTTGAVTDIGTPISLVFFTAMRLDATHAHVVVSATSGSEALPGVLYSESNAGGYSSLISAPIDNGIADFIAPVDYNGKVTVWYGGTDLFGPESASIFVANPVCGDSEIDPAEGCDDGNNGAGDGCSATCQIETGWTCAGQPSVCAPICGDGVTVGSEGCDDGAANGTPSSCCTVSCGPQAYGIPCTGGHCLGSGGTCIVPTYVAVGDSTTTGFSVPTCEEDRTTSPYGCGGPPTVIPYPVNVAVGDASFSPLYRLGIWGYTIHEAVVAADTGHNDEGPWEPQLLAAQKATNLVTVSLGANDMEFSDVPGWLKRCVVDEVTDPNACADAAVSKAESLRPDVQSMMNRLDAAAANGARVVVVLYYNPYNDQKDAGPFGLLSRDCGVIHNISEIIVGALNNLLQEEADNHGFTTVDLREAFRSHGAGSDDSFVFGSDCDLVGAVGGVDFDLGWPPDVGIDQSEIQKRFDPHPNAKGTAAQADEILKVVQ